MSSMIRAKSTPYNYASKFFIVCVLCCYSVYYKYASILKKVGNNGRKQNGSRAEKDPFFLVEIIVLPRELLEKQLKNFKKLGS